MGQLHEHLKYLQKRPSHLTSQDVPERSVNAGVSSAPRRQGEGAAQGRAGRTRERLRGQRAGIQSDMPNEHVTDPGGPHRCGVPEKAIRLLHYKYGVGSWKPGQMVPQAPQLARPSCISTPKQRLPRGRCPVHLALGKGWSRGPGLQEYRPWAGCRPHRAAARSQVNGDPSFVKEKEAEFNFCLWIYRQTFAQDTTARESVQDWHLSQSNFSPTHFQALIKNM